MPGARPQTTIVVVERQSVGLAYLLTFLFGPLGMLYSTVVGALVMLVVSVGAASCTAGLGLIITWPICILWGCMAASSSARQVVRGQ